MFPGKIGAFGALEDHCVEQSGGNHRHRLKRPHTKSRRGCFNCKLRKVKPAKCQETKPACENCLSRDMDCIYPPKGYKMPPELSTKNSSLTSTWQLSADRIAGDELRVFHHFLLVARPHLPYGSEGAWTSLVPAYAHECPHLMHAILSLGATHYALATPTGSHYTPMAISHRGKALRHLASALAHVDNCTDTVLDGILATCYTLVFQAYYMNDGLIDFAVMVRGCGMVTKHIQSRFQGSKMFLLQTPEQVSEMVAPWLPAEAHPNQTVLGPCIEDIDQLHPLLHSRSTREFFSALRNIYVALQLSVRNAFLCLTEVYTVWHTMENHGFMEFISSTNHVSRALFLHYLAIDTLMRPFLVRVRERQPPTLPFGVDVVDQWAHAIYSSLPATIQVLVKHEIDLISHEKSSVCFNIRAGLLIEEHLDGCQDNPQ
ncbi:uncharacterized protein N7482_010135 [Penicillium canariense]|uniref:Zn(2)-C6 fungal-type domain-containing protein n=1 Tax=Penicillium canariense TaxID=189055 RepID=A0A9W9HLF5_9EURO|nr:uncharacterized protein N7482_010135 [Penicillium canariense]KAJ5150883.1 hypothetical protein N7482_010135 [Penicillium canariense]